MAMDRLLLPQQPSSALSGVGCRGEFNLRPRSLCVISWPSAAAQCGVDGRHRHFQRRGRLCWASEADHGWRVEAVESGSSRATTILSSSESGDEGGKLPTMSRIWEKLQHSEGSLMEEDLVIRVPSVQDRCARAGGSLFAQRNGWMNQELLPILTSARGPQPEVEAPTPSLVSDSNAAGIQSQPSFERPIIAPEELKRLQRIGLPLKHHFKIGTLGVTDGVVQIMQTVWRNSELVKIKCHGPAADNMREVVEDIERKSGGSVIWSAGSVIIAYRGKDFVPGRKPVGFLTPEQVEVDRILGRLGPRYVGWQGAEPTPLDGDMLEGLAPQYCKPLRLLPCGSKAVLSSNEQTILRRAANLLPPHVLLGNPDRLEGVAYAVIQLWEKIEVVKIDVKKNIAHGNMLEMSQKLQSLTGGVIIARHKDCLLLYRGNDLPPPPLANALEVRRATLQGVTM